MSFDFVKHFLTTRFNTYGGRSVSINTDKTVEYTNLERGEAYVTVLSYLIKKDLLSHKEYWDLYKSMNVDDLCDIEDFVDDEDLEKYIAFLENKVEFYIYRNVGNRIDYHVVITL